MICFKPIPSGDQRGWRQPALPPQNDVESDVRELERRGAAFEDYDFPTLKTVDHVATTPGIGKSAWFKDPDGNTLALFQPE